MATRRQRYTGYARRAYRTRTYRKRGFGAAMNLQYLMGAALSFVPVNIPPIANTAIATVAVAPIRFPGGVKMAAQGFVLGKIIQQFVGNPLASGSNAVNTNGMY